MRTVGYILVGREIFPATALEVGAQLADMRSRRIELTYWPEGTHVSTVFLGLDHGTVFSEEPILFETTVFYRTPIPHDHTRRYATYAEAEAGHWQVVSRVTEELGMFPIREEEWVGG